ncbi:MAG TPA: heterodisulfide reductase-related iron-sulfur binding cluster, partial [Candidatus Paceibacterota bacterium]
TIFHRRLLRELNGAIDAAIFYGLSGIAFLIAVVFVQEFITLPFFNLRFLIGYYYLAFTLCDDFFSMLALIGLGAALFRRVVLRPSSVTTSRNEYLAFFLILSFLILGFLQNALRIAISSNPEFEIWAPVSYGLAGIFSFGSEGFLSPIHSVVWWLHSAAGLTLVALGASYYMRRLTVSLLNIYGCPPTGRVRSVKYSVSMSGGPAAKSILDFPAKQLMDLDACTGCGRCQDACPAFLAEKPLSPKKVIADLSRCLDEHVRAVDPRSGVLADYVKNDEIWSCTLCAACAESCPSYINHMQKIVDMRRGSDAVPEGYALAMTMISEKGSTVEDDDFRSTWFEGIDGVQTLAAFAGAEYLYFAGCGVGEESGKASARATLSLLRAAGVSVGVLGAEERCCGDAALRAGNDKLFKETAAANLERIAHYGVKQIVTSCPHGYNILNKEYRALAKELGVDASYSVVHHTQLLQALNESGQLKTAAANHHPVTFHDPCFLGRYNDEYDAPRALLASSNAIVIEMPRSQREGLCCGGHLRWNGTEGDALAEFRARDLYSSGARVAITACPHCVTMLRRGLAAIGATSVTVCDIAEYLAGGI